MAGVTNFFIILCCVRSIVSATPKYTIVSPEVIRPNTDFFVAVSTHDVLSNQDVALSIQGTTDLGKKVEINANTIVSANSTQLVRMRIGDLGTGSYKLIARGERPITFDDSTARLQYIHHGYTVFIQTDKAIYRPGNTIKFRVVILSPQLKPSVVGSIDVKITDGKGHLIKKFDRVFTSGGVFSGEIKIYDTPVMGNWNITADVSGQTYFKSIQVAAYVLPKFIVDIDLPKYGLFNDGSMKAVIKANYIHGGLVKGVATIAVYPTYKSSYLQPIFSDPVRRVVDISGQVEVEFDLVTELKLKSDFNREIVFDVQVKEDLTERIQNNTASYSMYKYPYKLELLRTAEAFKPGLQYIAFLRVAYQDNTPVKDDLNLVSVKWGFSNNPSTEYNVTEFTIPPKTGIIKLEFDTQVDDDESANVLGMEATYKGLVQWFSTIPRAVSRSGNYLEATLTTEYPSVGEIVDISVLTTEPIQSYSYQIFGRGKVVLADTVKVRRQSTSNEISFRLTSDMSPVCRVMVYYISQKEGDLITDSFEFDVKKVMNNFVEISMTKKQSFPGKDLSINIKSKPNSFVGLLAVDQNVRSLNTEYDITRNEVVSKLSEYDLSINPNLFPWYVNITPSLSWHAGSLSSSATFQDSGISILSNARMEDRPTHLPVESSGKNRPFGRPLPRPGVTILRADKGPGLEYESATRPPLAGPYAFSHIPVPVDNFPKIYLRNDLPDAWLFINTTTDSDGRSSIPVKAPELTNTTWDISGFSLNSLNGLGITKNFGSSLEVFQPFYVEVEVPPSVKRGETVAIQLVVYNYLTSEINADVTLENPGGTGFIFGTPNENAIDDDDKTVVDLFRTKRISIRPGRGTLVTFIITPLEIGELEMKITAKSSVGQDIQIEKMLVEVEGQTIRHYETILLDLRETDSLEQNFTLDLPSNALLDSERIYVSAIADPVGPAMNNLNQLLYYPTRSGESNLIRMIPSAIIAAYLEDSNQFEGTLRTSALRSMEYAYQNELTYRNSDGSFSSFEGDTKGSVWVTANVASAFQLAKKFIDIDESVLDSSMYWLTQVQEGDGSFVETGYVANALVQDSKVTLTAFVVLAFLNNKFELDSTMKNVMNRGINYLSENLSDDLTQYEVSILAYTLSRSQHPKAPQTLQLLQSLGIRDTEKNTLHWQIPLEKFEEGNPWTKNPNSHNIEMTAYALLTYLEDDSKFEDAISIVNWLLTQQNANGGFASSSDTFVAIQALTEFSRKLKISQRSYNMDINYSYLNAVRKMQVSSKTSTIMQRRILPQGTRSIVFKVTGSGIALLQIGYEYNLNVTAAWPSFVVDPQVFKASTANWMKVVACVNYIQDGAARKSNMAVMEVNLPSGFTVNVDSLPALRRYKGVAKVYAVKSNTKVILYFRYLTRSEVCPTISAFRTYRVSDQRPTFITAYDYFDQTRVSRSFFDGVPATLCDICSGDDCPEHSCVNNPTFGSFFGDNIDSNTALIPYSNPLPIVLIGLVMCVM